MGLSKGGHITANFGPDFEYKLQDEDISTLDDLLGVVKEGWDEYYREHQREEPQL